MKNIFYFIAFFFLLCACSKSDKIVIGVSQCTGGEWREQMNREILSEAGLYNNVEVRIHNASGDIRQQIRDIRQLVEEKVNLLVLSPLEDSALIDSFNCIDFQNIPVLIADRRISSNKYISFVGASNWKIGEKAAIYIHELRGNLPTNVVHIKGHDLSTATIEREAGFLNGISAFNNISVSTIVSGPDFGGTRMDYTLKVLNDSLEILKKADVIYAFNDAMALSAYNVLKSAGVTRFPYIIGVDGLLGHNKGINSVRDGILTASIVYPTGGRKIIEIAMQIIKGVSVPKENFLASILVDKYNVQAYYEQGLEIQELQQKIDLLRSDKKEIYVRYRHLIILIFLLGSIAVGGLLVCWKLYKLIPRKKEESSVSIYHREEEEKNSFKEEILAFVEFHYREENCDFSVLLDNSGMSRVAFYKKFKHYFNDTPNNFLKRYRLEKSKELILLDKYTYAEIGYQVGFSSPAYFTKCFKEEYDMTPSRFFELKKGKRSGKE